MRRRQKGFTGFTLVEILIVVVILGILAAIVIPQFSDASTEAKTSSLISDLQTVRSQIQLYKIQHNDALPTAAGIVTQLTGKTDIDGTANSSGAYGPYLQQFPTNPFNDLATVADATAGDNSHGWDYDVSTGNFVADDSNAHAAY